MEGLLIALDNIDEIVRIIRNSPNTAEAKVQLMERFALSDKQAQAILDMRLARLTGLERERLQEEYAELEKTIAYLRAVLADEKMVLGIIREEIEAGKYLIMSSHQMATVEEFCTDLTILDRSRTVLQGHLNDIKRSYGRVHLQLKTEEDAGPYIAESGAQIVTRKEFEYQLKVTGQEQANDLLARLTRAGVTVVLFNLREPSLHEIFVETVGGESDA